MPEAMAGLPVPPRPWEREGCADHPIRGSGFKFNSFSDVSDQRKDHAAVGGSVQILDVDPSSWWDTHQVDSLSASGFCDAAVAVTITKTAPGLLACWSPGVRPDVPQKSAGFIVRVDPRHYAGPLGQPLAIRCVRDFSSEVDDFNCELSYRIADDVGVWYDFRTSLLPLDAIIAFDRELRRRLSESEVTDYWWPALP
jgi:hypothetical protein